MIDSIFIERDVLDHPVSQKVINRLKNGILPNNAIRIQEEDVSRKASCIIRRCLFPPLVERKRAIPNEIDIKELIRNANQEEF